MDQGTTAPHISVVSQPLSENDSGLDFGCEAMDDSLTDMQWLQKMDAGKFKKFYMLCTIFLFV